MLPKGYSKEIFRPEWNPSFQSLYFIAHLDQDVSETLLYPSTVLGGLPAFKGREECETSVIYRAVSI